MVIVNFYQAGKCSFPCPFCQTPHRHRWNRMSENYSNIAAVCPCQLESRLSPDDDRDRTILCLLPAWSSLPSRKTLALQTSMPSINTLDAVQNVAQSNLFCGIKNIKPHPQLVQLSSLFVLNRSELIYIQLNVQFTQHWFF